MRKETKVKEPSNAQAVEYVKYLKEVQDNMVNKRTLHTMIKFDSENGISKITIGKIFMES